MALIVNAIRSAVRVVDARRQGPRGLLRHEDLFGVAAEARADGHAIAGLHRAHTFADNDDIARAFHAR